MISYCVTCVYWYKFFCIKGKSNSYLRLFELRTNYTGGPYFKEVRQALLKVPKLPIGKQM